MARFTRRTDGRPCREQRGHRHSGSDVARLRVNSGQLDRPVCLIDEGQALLTLQDTGLVLVPIRVQIAQAVLLILSETLIRHKLIGELI